jgi:hypothetical protein
MKTKSVSVLIEEVLKMISDNLPKDDNLELLILKGHILLEYLMNQSIVIKSDNNYEIERSSFSFNQKIEILVILNLIENNSQIYQVLKIFNNLRNQIAHKFTFDRTLVDKLVKIGLTGTKGGDHLPINDIERAMAIKVNYPISFRNDFCIFNKIDNNIKYCLQQLKVYLREI